MEAAMTAPGEAFATPAALALAAVGLRPASIAFDGTPLSCVDVRQAPVLLLLGGAPAWSFT